MRREAAIALLGMVLLGACQHPAPEPVPAVLLDDTADTRAKLKTLIGSAIGRAQVEFGPGDPTEAPVIVILPPRLTDLETNSVARPTVFDIRQRGHACILVQRGTQTEIMLSDISCRPA